EIQRRARKLYVDDGEVLVTAEGFYLLDSESGKLRLTQYDDYARSEIRRLFTGAGDLVARWRTHDGRDVVLNALEERGITVDDLARYTGLSDADPLDLLVHVAWNLPVTSRRDRARRVQRAHAEFFESFAPEARLVLQELLEKYAEFGPTQLDDLEVLEVPPL